MSAKATKRSTRKLQREIVATKHAINGRRLKLRAAPPIITQLPWNTVQISSTMSSDGLYTLGHLVKDMSAQGLLYKIGNASYDSIVVRILEVRAWETSGHSLTLAAVDLLAGAEYIAQFEDQPARNGWARIGYVWPKSHQTQVFPASTGTETKGIFYVSTQSGASTDVKAHLKILYKRFNVSLPGESVAQRVLRHHVEKERMSQDLSKAAEMAELIAKFEVVTSAK